MSTDLIGVEAFFGGRPYVEARAPGRVNLLGEHTDYNDGFMLPVATALSTRVCVAAAGGADTASTRESLYYSATLREQLRFCADTDTPAGFARYVAGCVHLLEEGGVAVPPLLVYIDSELPPGAGLSSSAALEVATLRALRRLLGFTLDDLALALLAQQAEIRYAGVQCGVMDQMACSLANEHAMLLIDARSLATRRLPLPAGSEIVVVDSGVPRLLAASNYNLRRAECEQAARLLGVASLRDVADPAAVEGLASPWRQRARHVVTENARVLAACEGVDAVRFGQLMNASHASLRDDYAVSIDALDRLVEQLRASPGVFGARLTGAGFGGACVALARRGAGLAAGRAAVARFNGQGAGAARLLLPVAAGEPSSESPDP